MGGMEIRDPRLRERKIHMFYARFLFHTCRVCGYEFRHVNMWRWIDSWWPESGAAWACACTSCVPEFKDIFEHIDGYEALERKEPSDV